MLFAILILILVPLILNNVVLTNFIPISGMFRPSYEYLLQIFFVSCIILGWIGGNPAISPYIEIGFINMLIYFLCLTYGLYLSMILEFCSYSAVFFIDYVKYSIAAYYKGAQPWLRYDWELNKDITLLKIRGRHQVWLAC